MTSNVDFEDCKCKISPDFIIYMLARPTFGGLWSQNCLKDEHVLLGVHVFQDDVSYDSIHLGGVLVIRMAYLLYVLFYWKTFLTG